MCVRAIGPSQSFSPSETTTSDPAEETLDGLLSGFNKRQLRIRIFAMEIETEGADTNNPVCKLFLENSNLKICKSLPHHFDFHHFASSLQRQTILC